MKYIFAGDRDISVEILRFMLEQGYYPAALLISEKSKASHANELIVISGLPSDLIFEGKTFTTEQSIKLLKSLNADYIIGIHFPYIVPQEVLDIPKTGFLNLHPAYLPYNKGWHTPSWAILEGTPYGATLHLMASELDGGDIIHQKQLLVSCQDTAHILYQRVKKLEVEVFQEAFPSLLDNPVKVKQLHKGTIHFKKDLSTLQQLQLDEFIKVGDLLKRLRALTTSQVSEAAYFVFEGKKYYVQVTITPEP